MKKKSILAASLVGFCMALSAQNTSCHFDLSLLPGTGTNNAAFGLNTMTLGTTGDFNSALGNQALMSNSSGANNVAAGYSALQFNTSGSGNTAVGYNALLMNGSNGRNTALGFNALSSLTSGQGYMNTALGFQADVGSSLLINNATAIGANAKVMNSNQMILGDTNVNVGIGLNLDPLGPQSKLEIRSGTSGVSGLKFRNLNSSFPVVANPGTGVLALDPAGRVIYVNPGTGGGGGSSPGGYCGSSTTPLSGDFEMPMASFNYNFSIPSGSGTGMLLGYPACQPPAARLDVNDDFIGNGISSYCASGSAADNIGVNGTANHPGGSGPGACIGVMGVSKVPSPDPMIGYAGIAGFCHGVAALSAVPAGTDIAVYGNAQGGNFAGYFDGEVQIIGTAPAVPSSSLPPTGYALEVIGNAHTTAWAWFTSDRRFKKNIRPLEGSLDKLFKLGGYNYEYRLSEFPEKRFNGGNQIGLIAQEVKEIFPELVSEGKDGYLAVNYVGLVPVLLEGMKEQQAQINELKAMIQNMAGGSTAKGTNQMAGMQSVSISDKNVVVLDQNVPNPFAESTVINYNIPGGSAKAQLIFSSQNGMLIKAVDITTEGQGSITVFANDLSHGVYTYSLVVDGKVVDTKRMIKE